MFSACGMRRMAIRARIKRYYSWFLWIVFISFLFLPYLVPYISSGRKVRLENEAVRNMSRADQCIRGSLFAGFTKGSGLKGRLGNAFYLFASAYGIAKYSKRCLYISSKVKKFITSISTVSIESMPLPPQTVDIYEKKFATYDPSLRSCEAKNIRINGFLQSWKYFAGYESTLRAELQLKVNLVRFSQNQIQQIRSHFKMAYPGTLIAVHIRLGDKGTKKASNRGIQIAPVASIKKSMDYFRRTFSNVTFIVASDDLDWCRKNFIDNDVYVLSDMDAVKHFAILTQCQHTIMTVGTFGWWVAWMVGGQTIYYDTPIKSNTTLSKGFTLGDHFYPTWIAMSELP